MNRNVLFSESRNGTFVPRSVFVDLDPCVHSNFAQSKYRQLYSSANTVWGKEDCSNNCFRGRYTVGRVALPLVEDKIRKLSEKCDRIQGFVRLFSINGGTGSGLGCSILERLSDTYGGKGKTPVIGFCLYPSPKFSSCVVEPYNSVLCTETMIEHETITVVMDNESLYRYTVQNRGVEAPRYEDVNSVIAKYVSGLLGPLREKRMDLGALTTNLVPFPRIHFCLPGLVEDVEGQIGSKKGCVTTEMTRDVFLEKSRLADWKQKEEERYMCANMTYNGDFCHVDVMRGLHGLRETKGENRVRFVEWSGGGYKCCFGGRTEKQKSVGVLANGTHVRQTFRRMEKNFFMLVWKRAFIHWYSGEGGEAGTLPWSGEVLKNLTKDYDELLKETEDESDYYEDEDSEETWE